MRNNLKNILKPVEAPKPAEPTISLESAAAIADDLLVNEQLTISVEERDLEEAQTVLAELDAICVSVEAIKGEEGLTAQAAGILSVAVNNTLTRVGASADGVIPSMESFGGEQTQLEATDVSMEAVKDNMKAIGEWIVKQFEAIRKAVRSWFKKVITGSSRMQKKFEELAEKFEKMDGDIAFKKDSEDKVAKAAGRLAVDGKFSADLLKDVEALAALHGALVKDYPGFVEGQMTLAEALVDGINGLAEGDKEFDLKEADTLYNTFVQAFIDEKNPLGDVGETQYIAGRVVTIANPKDEGGYNLGKKVPTLVVVSKAEAAKVEKAEYKLTAADMAKVCKAMAEMLKAVEELEDKYFENAKLTKPSSKLAKIKVGDNNKAPAVVKQTASALLAVENSNNKVVTGINGGVLAAAGGTLALIAQIEMGKKEDKKGGDE